MKVQKQIFQNTEFKVQNLNSRLKSDIVVHWNPKLLLTPKNICCATGSYTIRIRVSAAPPPPQIQIYYSLVTIRKYFTAFSLLLLLLLNTNRTLAHRISLR